MKKKYVTAQCASITSPCPVYYFLIKTAQLGELRHWVKCVAAVFLCFSVQSVSLSQDVCR